MSKNNELAVMQKETHTGKITMKHRAMCYALGSFLIWLGKRLRDVKTYEELQEIILVPRRK